MSALIPPYETRLRAHLMSDAIHEANKILASGQATEEDIKNLTEMLAEVLIEMGTSFAPVWLRFLDTLRGPGMPGAIVRNCLHEVRAVISGTEQLLPVLQTHAVSRREALEAFGLMIAEVKRTVAAIEPATVFPAIDSERIRQAQEEAAPHEWEDVEDTLARVKAGGPV